MHETDAAVLANFRLDAVLGFELREKLVRLEGLAEHVDLPLDGGEVARREQFQRAQPLALLVGEALRITAQGRG